MKSAVLLYALALFSLAFAALGAVAYKPHREQAAPHMHQYSDGGYGYYVRPGAGAGVFERQDGVQPLKDGRKPLEKGPSKLASSAGGYGYMKQSAAGAFDRHESVQPPKDGPRKPADKGSKPATNVAAHSWGKYAGTRGGAQAYPTKTFLQKHLQQQQHQQQQQQQQPVQWQHYSNAAAGRPVAHSHY